MITLHFVAFCCILLPSITFHYITLHYIHTYICKYITFIPAHIYYVCTMYYIPYTIYCILLYYLLYTIYYLLFTIYCILYTILYTIYYILYTIDTIYYRHYILYTIYYILDTTYSILYIIGWLLVENFQPLLSCPSQLSTEAKGQQGGSQELVDRHVDLHWVSAKSLARTKKHQATDQHGWTSFLKTHHNCPTQKIGILSSNIWWKIGHDQICGSIGHWENWLNGQICTERY